MNPSGRSLIFTVILTTVYLCVQGARYGHPTYHLQEQGSVNARKEPQPNIVVIVADDLVSVSFYLQYPSKIIRN